MTDALRFRARGLLLVSAVLFGLVAALTRMASLRGFGPGQLATLRFAVGTVAMAGLFVARPAQLVVTRRGILAARGILGGLAVVLYFFALARIPAGEATLLNNLYPVLSTVLAVLVLGERPTLHLVAALALTTLGVFLVLGGGHLELDLGLGELAGLASSVLSAGAIAAIRAARLPGGASRPATSSTVFFAFSVFGLAVSWPFALHAWPTSPAAWAIALGAALAALLAQLTMTEAFGYLPIPEASIWQQLAPVTSYFWAAGLLGEPVGAATLAGVLVAMAGVAYGAVLGQRPAPIPSGRQDGIGVTRETVVRKSTGL